MKIKFSKNKIKFKTIKPIKNNKGNIFKIISSKNNFFDKFGDCYISEINPKKVKAWRYHKFSNQKIFLITGKCKVVIYFNKKIKKFVLSEKKPGLLFIPQKHWYGFKNIGKNKVKLLNIVNLNYNEKEIQRKNKNQINYEWN